MSTHILARDFPDRDPSTDRFWGFVAPALPASVELAPEVAEQQPAPKLEAAARPDWWTDGTLPGVMAGKRPAL
jgi:hypothetical protein